MLGRRFRRSWLGSVLLLLVLGSASAETPTWLALGEPWELGIFEGIEEQDRERQRMQPVALVGRYTRLAARRAAPPEMVKRYYLLGRAHGLYYADIRAEAEAAATSAQKTQLAREASRAFDGAVRAYREALAIAPRCYFCYHDMGILELQRETPNQDTAVAHLTQASTINPKYPDPLRKMVMLLTSDGKWNDAIPMLRRLIDLEPQDVLARVTLANAYSETGQLETAYEIARQLIEYDPKNPMFVGLIAQLDFRSGKLDAAQNAFRGLAEAHPTQRQWVSAYLACLQAREQNKQQTRPEDVIWALNGLLRLERDPVRRQTLRDQLESIKAQVAKGLARDPSQPPTAEDLVRVLTGPDEEGRYQVISFLNSINEEPPPAPFMNGLISRLSHKGEPSARVRIAALEIAGKHFGFAFLPLLRLVARQDPEPEVRIAAIDAITRMGEISASVKLGAILNIALSLDDDAMSVAAAARLSILNLGSGRLRIDDEAGDAEHREAFRVWWRGPQGEDLKIRALGSYARIKDKWVDDILLGYLSDDAFFVRQAAHGAFVALGALLATPDGEAWYQKQLGSGFDRFKTWVLSLPKPAGGTLTQDNVAALEGALEQWTKSRP